MIPAPALRRVDAWVRARVAPAVLAAAREYAARSGDPRPLFQVSATENRFDLLSSTHCGAFPTLLFDLADPGGS